jgi:hypothetical protein
MTSVVDPAYKAQYAQRAAEQGRTSHAAKRSNNDWLAQKLEAECIIDGSILDLPRFCAILVANGVADPLLRWPNRNAGWQGRLRMSGGLALRSIVRKTGVLTIPVPANLLAE